MPDRLSFGEDLTVAAQPSEAELEALRADGVRTIINLRHDGEDRQPMPPEEEGRKVRDLGMAYVHVPVSMGRADAELVDEFRAKLDAAAKPALVHCKLGQRAGAFVLMHEAARAGWSRQRALMEAKDRGLALGDKLERFVGDYLDHQSA